MKKVGKLTEACMVHPEEPKTYPMVSDTFFENKVKGYAKMPARKKLKEDDLPMNQTPEASKMTTNSPRRATPKSVQVGGPMDLTAEGSGDNWIQGAEEDIERRGTKGKCTPITKKGCTGRAKALATTFQKMAKREKQDEGQQRLRRVANAQSKKPGISDRLTPNAKALANTQAKIRQNQKDRANRTANTNGTNGSTNGEPSTSEAFEPGSSNNNSSNGSSNGNSSSNGSSNNASGNTPTPGKAARNARKRSAAGRPIKKGTAKMVASDEGQPMDTAIDAASKLTHKPA